MAASAALLLGLLQPAAAAPGATAGPRADVTVVLDTPSPPTVWEDSSTQLTGTLSNGRPGKLITLQKELATGWQSIASTRTDDTGAFAFTVTPANPWTISFRAVHPIQDGFATSNTEPLTVLDRRVFIFAQASYNTFDTIAMTGLTRPRTPGQRVYIQHLVDGRFVSGGSGLTNADGEYTIDLRNNQPGLWTVRAYWPAVPHTHAAAEYSGIHRFTVHAVLDAAVTHVTLAQLGRSYHAGCPVGPGLLRNITMTFRTFGPYVGRGTLVVRDTLVDKMIGVFGAALAHSYPIRHIFPTAHYGGSDIASMNHDNTSAFNCRTVTGDPTHLSPHSYGIAIDVDTVENPYQDVHGTWWPRNLGQRFRNRGNVHPGMLYDNSLVTTSMRTRGLQWGGVWSHPDYQHFDTLGAGLRGPAAKVAGPLGAWSMPSPSVLGVGWRRYAGPGGPEAGWMGNGTFVHARGGREASRGVRPLGCAARPRAALPDARFALQGSYQSRGGAPAQAVVLRFRTPGVAAAYFAGLEQALQACTRADGPSGVAVAPVSVTRTTYTGTRTYAGREVWAEADSRSGARVTVLLSRR